VATYFIVSPGHEDPGIEHVVQHTERFLVVEKEARPSTEEPAACSGRGSRFPVLATQATRER
jgi:hypothetical protein